MGTQNLSTNDEITDWMREQLLKSLRTDVVTHVVSNGWSLLGIAAHTDQVETETIAQVQRNINTYGLQIVRLGNFTITLKPEDEEKLKSFLQNVQYTKLAGGFQQYAAGEAMLGAGKGLAQGPGQGGGNPAFLGVGVGVSEPVVREEGVVGGQHLVGRLVVLQPQRLQRVAADVDAPGADASGPDQGAQPAEPAS